MAMYLKTVSELEATGEIAASYESDRSSMGVVMEATSCWSARPDMLAPIEHVLHQLRDGFSLGLLNFRLVTFIAAKHVPSSYCSHMYFRSLSRLMPRDQVIAVHRDYWNAGLTAQQVEMLAYAEQITRDASKITQSNIDRLRAVGLSDLNIADIALAASYRNFMSRYFDAVGATVEPQFLDEDMAVREMLNVGMA
jgi:alkylhydroperoxidase family enzyme